MAAVAQGSPADILPDTPLAPDPVSVTMPARRLGPKSLLFRRGVIAVCRALPWCDLTPKHSRIC